MDEVDAPLVFHCNACRSIVADSWSFVVANEAEQWLCTSSALSATSVCAQRDARAPAVAVAVSFLQQQLRHACCSSEWAHACADAARPLQRRALELSTTSHRAALSLSHFGFDTAARSVRLAEELETAQSGTEAGSTSRRMHCVQCDAALGRVFVTTTSDMDRFRDNFTFDTDSLGSYKV